MVKSTFNDDVDALFRLPLTDFIAARKTLVAQLKRAGRVKEAERVQTFAKPPISAWTVNQLYWNHGPVFEGLMSAGARFRKAQTSRSTGKIADMHEALDARREALSDLSDLAATLLSDAGHNASLDTLRRITTTLEAMSAYAQLPDDLSPGRLTKDVDPPGFESLAAFVPGAATTTKRTEESAKLPASKKSTSKTPASKESRVDVTRQAKIAAAKTTLQNAKKSLSDARTRAQSLEVAHEKADAEAKTAEKSRREAEVRFKKASSAAELAARRAENVRHDVEDAIKGVEDAKRAVEKASKELERSFRQS